MVFSRLGNLRTAHLHVRRGGFELGHFPKTGQYGAWKLPAFKLRLYLAELLLHVPSEGNCYLYALLGTLLLWQQLMQLWLRLRLVVLLQLISQL